MATRGRGKLSKCFLITNSRHNLQQRLPDKTSLCGSDVVIGTCLLRPRKACTDTGLNKSVRFFIPMNKPGDIVMTSCSCHELTSYIIDVI